MTECGRARAGRGRGGGVLPLLLLLLLALTLLGHGVLLLALKEGVAARSFLHGVRAASAASGAVTRSLDPSSGFPGGERVPWEEMILGSGWSADGLWQESALTWLGAEFFLLEGRGRSRGWPGRRRRGIAGWALDPVARIGAMEGGLELGGGFSLGTGGSASVEGPSHVPEGWDPGDCSPFRPPLDSLWADAAPVLYASLAPEDSAAGGGDPGPPGLGLLRGEEILSLAGGGPGAASAPWPLAGSPGCPGSGIPLFHGVQGDLTISGQRVCGLLVVGGDLRVRGGGSFQGLALVAGDLLLEGAGRFEGMARARGSAVVEESSILRISGCPALRALSGISSLRKTLVLIGRSPFPLF